MASLADKPICTRTLGPVADLEKHLPHDWWKSLFNSLYLKTDGDVVENNDNTVHEIDMFLQATHLPKDAFILDLCCGQGRHTIELHKRGYLNATGIDRSRYLIRVAKKRAQQLGYSIKFSEGDARKIRFKESSLDCVAIFGNSFGYFESKDEDLVVLKSILRALKSNGVLVMDIVNGAWMKEHFEKRSWEWIDETHFCCRERSLSKDQSRIISREVVVHAEKGVIADQFYAERIYAFEQIKQILESLHFSDVTLCADLKADSHRNQDLGMMANRLFLKAIAPLKVPKKEIKREKLSLLVLLGDPRQSDKVKLGGKFNEEDIATVNKLKTALATTSYNFSYLDNHKRLFDYLKQTKPSYILNLCDEGYNNHATLELHIPAMLELFEIPYSGAGPVCLATCYNKALVRSLAASLDIPVPLETYLDVNDQAATIPSIFPAIVKPNTGDSSIGITQHSVAHTPNELVFAIDKIRSTLPDQALLIQEYLSGKEYSVGIIGNPGNFHLLPILAVDFSKLPHDLPKILGYESKWDPDSTYWNNIVYEKATVDADIERQLYDYSMLLFERLECRDYARFDFRCDAQGHPKLLEVNPNPGWCWDGKLNLMAGFAGKTYNELLEMIINAFFERIQPNFSKI